MQRNLFGLEEGEFSDLREMEWAMPRQDPGQKPAEQHQAQEGHSLDLSY